MMDDDAPLGGLGQLAQEPDPFASATQALTARSASGEAAPNIFDEVFLMDRLKAMMPDPAEISGARERALSYYNQPPIDRTLPWLKFSAGMLRPTKTGAFGESLGYGLDAYSEEMGKVNAAELAAKRHGAEFDYSSLIGQEKLTHDYLKTGAALKKAEQLLQKGTPVMQEHGWLSGRDLPPETPPDQRAAELERRKRIWTQRLGTTQQKNAASILDPNDPNYGNMIRALSDQRLVTAAMAQAAKDVPEDAFRGQPVEELQRARTQRFLDIMRDQVGRTQPGTASPTPVSPPALPGAPQVGGNGAPPGAATPPAARAPVEDLPGHVLAQAPVGTRARIIPNKEQEKAAAEDYSKNVLPHVATAEKLKGAVLSLNEVDPSTSPISGLVSALGKAGSVIGLPADNALVREATKINNGQKVVEALRNDILQMAKGVQTEGDAERALTQIASMTDMKQVFESTKALMSGLAQRAIEKQRFFNQYATVNNGDYVGAAEIWSKHASDIPLIKRVKYKDGTEGVMSYTQYIEERRRMGHEMSAIMQGLRGR